MRKTLFAMLGLVALGLWALPTVAAPTPGGLVVDGPAKVVPDPIPLENRAGAIGAMARGDQYQGTLSGTLIKQTAVTTSWFLYPGACVERSLGSWAAKSSPVADSLQPTSGFPNSSGYTDGQPDPAGNTIAYTREDLSLSVGLWHVIDASNAGPEQPPTITGSRSIWCGTFDPNWVVKVGYPNLTMQILYFDTGTHAGSYSLTFSGNISVELNYDYVNFLGGGGLGQPDHVDPLLNLRHFFADMIPQAGVGHGGPHGDSQQLVTWTGAITSAQSVAANTSNALSIVEGSPVANPVTTTYAITSIPADHRAIYVVMTADCLFSSEDGLWPNGAGQILDNISTSDNGAIWTDEVDTASETDPTAGANSLKGTYGTLGYVAGRIPPGVGELWQLAPGNENVTNDLCSPQKQFSTDLFFEGGDPTTNLSINKQFNTVIGCAFPVPAGTAQVLALWSSYFDLPQFSGLVQDSEFRLYKDGTWGLWQDTDAAGFVNTGSTQAWGTQAGDLAAATQADSVQVRYMIRCIPPFAADQANCSSTQQNALLYDDFRLQVTTGVPAPLFGIFTGGVAQTTFVDGQIKGTNCQTTPCWPGNRGSDQGTPLSHNIAVNDNWNAPIGDSITLALVTGLRKNGMGVNWKNGFCKTYEAGELGPLAQPYCLQNGSYNAAFDTPRMIYRLFDPTAKAWSPFDSCEVIPSAVQIADPDGGGPAPPETTLVNSDFNINWPPYDKSVANASLPGPHPSAPGWLGSINGVSAYNQLRFLPRGTRMQYYFKAVDINGGTSYQFSSDALAREVEDLPELPGSSIKAPDIIEWRVLPGVYAAGPAGSLLDGRTNTPLLNLDRVYTSWSFGYDPVTQALRALGVRPDRYRFLGSGTTSHGVGGHELPGGRPDRLSNFFPNYLEMPLVDSLASWYRIIIESGHTRTALIFNASDAVAVDQWWRKDTGTNGGDRCILATGDDLQNTQLTTTAGTAQDQSLRIGLAQNVFGVSSTANAWTGTTTNTIPTIDDRFAGGTAAGLAAAGTFTYPLDGACPGPNKFDRLIKIADAGAVNAVTYPNSEVAGIAYSTEKDNIADNDRNKSLAYGFSIQFIRDPAYGPTNANWTRSGVENRMRVLYKFLTSCRRTTGTPCWPCPVPGTSLATMRMDWNGQSGSGAGTFETATHGQLYNIQAGALATGVDVPGGEGAPRINKIDGNFPNPFNPQTAIRFQSAQVGKAQIRIFSVGGQLVRTLNATVNVGANEVRWNGKKDDGTSLASGVYFYKIVFPNGESFRAPNNLVLVK